MKASHYMGIAAIINNIALLVFAAVANNSGK